MPNISVIIPIYGVEQYIERCARSLFEQTLDDIEYLFINDCTKDNSIFVLKSVLEEYPNRANQVRIINMENNSGQAAVRKTGIVEAKGDYIIHCDSDDWVELNAYSKLYNKAKEGNYDIVFSDFYLSDGNTKVYGKRVFTSLKQEIIISDILLKVQWSVWGYLCKRNIFLQNPIAYSTYNMGEDMLLTIQAVYYSTSISYINEPCYNYFINPTSIMNSEGYEKCQNRMAQTKGSTDLLISFMKAHQLYERYSNEIISLKLSCRFYLSAFSDSKEGRKLWYSVYPELEKIRITLNKIIPLHQKKHYLAVKFHCYNFIRNIQRITKKLR